MSYFSKILCKGVGALAKCFPRVLCTSCDGGGYKKGYFQCPGCDGVGSIWVGNLKTY